MPSTPAAVAAPFRPYGLRQGPLWMILAAFSFVLMLGCVRIARVTLSPWDVIFWRCPPAILLTFVMAWGSGFRIVNKVAFGYRAVFGFLALLSFYTAAGGLRVADLTLIGRLQPLLMAVAAPLVLGASERAGSRVWFAVVAGLIGCGILLAPDLSIGSPYGLAAVCAICLAVGAHLALRRLGATDATWPIVFWFQLAVWTFATLVSLGAAGGLPAVPSSELWLPLMGAGVFAACGQGAMTRAYALDRAAVVSAASHVMPVFGFTMDAVVFGESPSMHGLVGGAIVLGAAMSLVLLDEEPEAAAA